MSRDVGVVRDRVGLERLLAVVADLEAEHGRALPLIAARMVGACALNRTESRGGHYRADGTGPQPPHRTFVHWADLPLAPTLRFAAE
jgi:L-aspartate oxidase